MLAVASISRIRYSDIDRSRLSPRTTSVTCRACFARYSAVWPAEFPPPTTKTSWPAIARSSLPAAP